jgi:hypothetical protein
LIDTNLGIRLRGDAPDQTPARVIDTYGDCRAGSSYDVSE